MKTGRNTYYSSSNIIPKMTLLVLILLMCISVECQQDERGQLHDLNYRCAQDLATVMESVLVMQNRIERHEEEMKAQIENQAKIMESQMEAIQNITEILQNQQAMISQVATNDWTVIQRRVDGDVSFYRTWEEYKQGFGEQDGSFWIGLDKLHKLTKHKQHVLHVDLTLFNSSHFYAEYDNFRVGSEAEGYKLHVSGYSGTAGNGLANDFHNGMMFSTKDRENDSDKSRHCADIYKSGWWFGSCFISNLNGLYWADPSQISNEFNGTIWNLDKKYPIWYIKFAEMKIKHI